MKETYKVTLETPTAIIERDSRRSDEVRQRLQQLDANTTLNAFEQADLWAEAKQNAYWADWKFESFFDYIKKSGVDLSKREIYSRIQISAVSNLLGINKTQLAKAKYSKLKEICKLDPNSTLSEVGTGKEEKMSDIMIQLVQDAPSKSLVEIKEIVKRLQGNSPESDADTAGELTWLNLPVRRDAKEVVISAIELAVSLSGGTIDAMTKDEKDISQATALERICADFKADPNNQLEDMGEEGEFEDEIEDVENDTLYEED